MIKEKRITNHTIISAAVKVTGKPANVLRGASRNSSVVAVRNLCFKIAKDHLFLADRDIAIAYNRDRSAVTYALKHVEKKLEERPQYKLMLQEIEQELGLI